MNKNRRILIVDDQRLFADGLRLVIELRAPEFDVVGIAPDGRQAIAMTREHRPGIVLMDVRMPEMDGVQATKAIMAEFPDTKVLILTTFSDDEYVRDSLGYGAIGYLLKNRLAEELVYSIRAVAEGIVQLDPTVSKKLLERDRRSVDNEFTSKLRTLSPREREVLSLMAKLYRVRLITKELGIAEQTVRNHMSNMYFKLGIHDRLELVRYIDVIHQFLAESD